MRPAAAETVAERASGLSAGAISTTDILKVVGLACVLADHWGLFFASEAEEGWWRVAGRVAAPIFFFLIGFAGSRRVPWSWIGLGLGLTAIDAWTDHEASGAIQLNILLNFALIRLALPWVERYVMPCPWRVAALAGACILLVGPVEPWLEYGPEGWLWALVGLARRAAVSDASRRTLVQAGLIGVVAAATYVTVETRDLGFETPQAAVLAGLVAALTAALAGFRRADMAWDPPPALRAPIRFAGRHSLELYAASLAIMQIAANVLD